jgi:thioredoxin-dependent adenylylsulfate APS reductase
MASVPPPLGKTGRLEPALLEFARSDAHSSWDAERVLAWGMDTFAARIALSSSFGAPEGMVVLDLMHRLRPRATRVFTIDTGRLPQETYNLMDRVRERYEIEIEVFFPDAERVQKLVRQHGLNLFYESVEKRQLCCAVRKVEPLERALEGLDAWITGLRAEQSAARELVRGIEIDEVHGGRIKLNPLHAWTREDVMNYVRAHHVPIHAFHGRGYPSVGCAPCSRAVQPGEPERSGRWWWEEETSRECGIHTGYEDKGSGI